MILAHFRSVDVLRVFYSTDMSDRFSRLLFEHRTEFFLWNLSYADFRFLIDHIFSQLDISKLSLSNFFIPCLTEHYSSFCQAKALCTSFERALSKHLEQKKRQTDDVNYRARGKSIHILNFPSLSRQSTVLDFWRVIRNARKHWKERCRFEKILLTSRSFFGLNFSYTILSLVFSWSPYLLGRKFRKTDTTRRELGMTRSSLRRLPTSLCAAK